MNECYATSEDPRHDLRLTFSLRLETLAGEKIAEIRNAEAIGPAILSPAFLDTAESAGVTFLNMNLVSPVRSLLRAKIHVLRDKVGFLRRDRLGLIPQHHAPGHDSLRSNTYRTKVAQAVAARRGKTV